MHVLPGTSSWLASPQTDFLTPTCNYASCIVTSMEVPVDLLHLCIRNHHGLHLRMHSINILPCTQAPPSIQIAIKGCQLTGLEPRNLMMYL
eukprot:1143847-Pelagomonas_calceolata.AAC.5